MAPGALCLPNSVGYGECPGWPSSTRLYPREYSLREKLLEAISDGLDDILKKRYHKAKGLSLGQDYLNALPHESESLQANAASPARELDPRQAFTCSPCHNNPNSRLFIPIDPTDPVQWRKWLSESSPSARQKANNWLGRVIDRLSDQEMPPQLDSDTDTDKFSQERSALLKYLQNRAR